MGTRVSPNAIATTRAAMLRNQNLVQKARDAYEASKNAPKSEGGWDWLTKGKGPQVFKDLANGSGKMLDISSFTLPKSTVDEATKKTNDTLHPVDKYIKKSEGA